MDLDIGGLLDNWKPDDSSTRMARRIIGRDGKPKLQLRMPCGLLQMEADGRPDGSRPHGWPTVLDWLRDAAARHEARGVGPLKLSERHWAELDRELMQYYHRRICHLELRDFAAAIRDADHNLALMDLVAEHGEPVERVAGHLRFRPFVLLHRTQAAAQMCMDADDPEGAVEALQDGAERIRAFVTDFANPEATNRDPHLATLRVVEREIRKRFNIKRTTAEELAESLAREDFETAARLRDRIRRRRGQPDWKPSSR